VLKGAGEFAVAGGEGLQIVGVVHKGAPLFAP
jgi:hypothetical protein